MYLVLSPIILASLFWPRPQCHMGVVSDGGSLDFVTESTLMRLRLGLEGALEAGEPHPCPCALLCGVPEKPGEDVGGCCNCCSSGIGSFHARGGACAGAGWLHGLDALDGAFCEGVGSAGVGPLPDDCSGATPDAPPPPPRWAKTLGSPRLLKGSLA